MKIIPVLDVMNGVVVRAVGGRRAEYKPVVSKLTKSTDPADVLKALIDVTGSDVAYVADLDAISSSGLGGPSDSVVELADNSTVRLWVDCGIRTVIDLGYIHHDLIDPVFGTETMVDLNVAETGWCSFHRVIGSIDCMSGKTIGKNSDFTPVQLARQFLGCRFEKLIVLDLAAVGNTERDSLDQMERVLGIREIIEVVSTEASVFVGGGIHNREDITLYQAAGAAGVLVASALHDGMLP